MGSKLNPKKIKNDGKPKLSDSAVSRILKLKGVLSQKEIAEMFGVKRSTIAMVHANRSWRHIPRHTVI